MKYRVKIISLVAVLAVLTVTYGAHFFVSGPRSTGGAESPPVFAGVDPEDVSAVEIVNEGGTYILSRGKGGEWFVSEKEHTSGRRFPEDTLLPGNDGRIDPFIRELLSCGRDSVVTEDPEKYGQFEVADGSLPRVTVEYERGKKTLLFGTADSGGLGEYARLEGESAVLLTSRLSAYLNRNLAYWGDLSILPAAVTEKNLVSLMFEGKPNLDPAAETVVYGLQKTGEGDDSWVITDNDTPPDPVVVERLVRNLVNLKGSDYAAGPFPGEDSVLAVLRIMTSTGDDYTVSAAPGEEEDTVLVSVAGRDLVVKVGASVFKRVCLAPEDLFN